MFRFLIPLVTAWACHVFLGQSFTSKQLTAGLIAVVGVIFIAHPTAIFGPVDDATATTTGDLDKVTPAQRLLAICISLFGVLGASGAYTTIRVIGTRAHALISVNYFALIATAGSTAALLALPGGTGGFVMPRSATEWTLLLAMGVLGFALQFMLTAGLQMDRSPKATSMLYTQVLFALCFDWAIWGVLPGGWSLCGGAIVVASTLWSALQKNEAPKQDSETARKTVDEETALLGEQRDGPRSEGSST